jgi:hypothetical protein
MSIFANFSGGKSRKDILRSSAEAEARLAQGRTAALRELAGGETGATAAINQGYDAGRASVTQGYDAGRAAINQGYDTARGDIGTAADRARTDIATNYGAAENAVTDAMGRVRDVYAPFQQAGNWAQDLYNRALGAGGQEGVTEALAGGFDPYRQFRDEMLNKELQSQFNARGLGGSGRFASALSRASLERGSQDLQQYLTRLEGQAARGQNVASQVAGYEANAGNTIAGLRQGTGSQLASIEQNRGSTLGNLEQNRGNVTGQMEVNRGTVLGSQDINRGNALADITDRYANTRAGIESGTAQQLAANRINVGNGLAQTRSTGMNNLIGLGGLALSAYTGMPTGIGGRSSTTPGTAANGGWQTTTTRAGNPLFQFGNLFG